MCQVPRRLSDAAVTRMEAALERAHRAIHASREAGVTAQTLKALSNDLRRASSELDTLATSPFLRVQPKNDNLLEPR